MILIRSKKDGYIAEVDIDGRSYRSEFDDVVAAAEWARELKTANTREKLAIAKPSTDGGNPSTADTVPLPLGKGGHEDERSEEK